MGLAFSRLWARLSMSAYGRDCRIVMVGLDAAGKTTVLYKLRLGEVVHTVPTIGFNVETVEYRKLRLTVWDVGGQKAIRPLWRHYYQSSDAVIFVVDASDTERIEEVNEELHGMLGEAELSRAKLLVLANKQDLPGALGPNEIAEKLGLRELRNRQWFVQGCVAPSGAGLYEGLDWLTERLSEPDTYKA